MKRCFWMLLAALFCLPALRAQNLVIGARVADLKVSEYVVGQQPDDNRPVLVEFFFRPASPAGNVFRYSMIWPAVKRAK
ncbi:MAG: hypothetical protein ACLR1G_15980 [Alistipes indistinctus]